MIHGKVTSWVLAGSILTLLGLAVFGVLYLLFWVVFRKGQPLWAFLGSVLRSQRDAVRTNPDVVRLVERHPALFGFLERRFARGDFSGWPLTLLFLAFLYVFSLFMGSVEDLITSDAIISADVSLANLVYSLRQPGMTRIMLWVTLLGKWQIVAAAALTATVFLLRRSGVHLAVGLWLSLTGCELFTWLGKVAFHRPRPLVAEYLEKSYSFPSGHASIALGFYGFLLYLLVRSAWSWKVKTLLSALGVTVVLSIGFSRLYLGVHFLSDVWSGFLLGGLWLILGVAVSGVLDVKWRSDGSVRERPGPLPLPVFALGILPFVTLFVAFGLSHRPTEIRPPKPPSVAVDGDVIQAMSRHGASRYTQTITGANQEPFGFIILARDDRRLNEAFSAAGWSLAAPEGVGALARAGRAALTNATDLVAPMTPSFWEGKPHDFGFQKPLPGAGVRQRHHARFWRTPFFETGQGRYYLGTASLDVGLRWMVTHVIDPDIDNEREFLFMDLSAADQVLAWGKEPFTGKGMGKNFAGDPFFTDGEVYVLRLKE